MPRTRCRMWDWDDAQYAEMREKFHEAFEYDETSESFLRWKNTHPKSNCKPGDVAGYLTSDGYWSVEFESKPYQVHQVIWIMHGNTIPEPLEIDHIDNKRTNNQIDNLQLLTSGEQNLKRKNFGKSKYRGVSWDKANKKWQAEIKINGKRKYLGRYDSEVDAALAWDAAAIKLGRTDLNFPLVQQDPLTA